MVLCPDCGKDVPKAKFCKNCGAYISDIEEVNVIEEQTIAPVESGEDSIPVTVKSEDEVIMAKKVIPVESADEKSVSDLVKSDKIKFCFNCGHELVGNFNFCPECGQDLRGKVSNQNSHVVPKEKSTLLAVILSVFLPGLGQIYLGLDHKGAIFLIAYVVSAILILLLIGFILCIAIWIWALVDTISSANAINRGEEVNDKLL
ncbi:hypothetical protein [Methanobrevibacter sp.]|uniref:zinc ribbon domain-containing protein n=1 Tax=Methanobrevibacter sp. TaxID=66852 RepID=UPI003869E372